MAKDTFSQIAYLAVTESAANTLTFNGLSVFSNVLGQRGMIIHRIEYLVKTGTYALMTASGDGIAMGLAGSDALTQVAQDDPEVYDLVRLYRQDFGTAATGSVYQTPMVSDYNRLPGGGILVPADRLFLFVLGVSLGGAATINARVRFTLLDMSPSDYLELAQAMRVLR